MDQELQDMLISRHPSIFRRCIDTEFRSCMAFGIECGNGWHELIDTLCNEIDSQVEYTNRLWPDAKFAVIAEQVKEKFGSLRFYIDFYYAHDLAEKHPEIMTKVQTAMATVSGTISMAERMSKRTCDQCGLKGTTDDSKFYLRVRCPDCRYAERKERNADAANAS